MAPLWQAWWQAQMTPALAWPLRWSSTLSECSPTTRRASVSLTAGWMQAAGSHSCAAPRTRPAVATGAVQAHLTIMMP